MIRVVLIHGLDGTVSGYSVRDHADPSRPEICAAVSTLTQCIGFYLEEHHLGKITANEVGKFEVKGIRKGKIASAIKSLLVESITSLAHQYPNDIMIANF